MRTRDILVDAFDDILILQRYLYISEKNHIEITNSIGVKLRIRMEENLHYYCKNTNFPDIPESYWSDNMTNDTMLAIIGQLKEAPAVEYPGHFRSRWEEIKFLTASQVSLNQ